MSHVHNVPLEDVLPRLRDHLTGRGYVLAVSRAGDPPVDEAQVLLDGRPSGVTVAGTAGGVCVSRHEFGADGVLSGVQLGVARPTSDMAGILSDLDDRLAARPLAGRGGAVFPATEAILARLEAAGVQTAVGDGPDWGIPFEVDRIRLLDGEGEGTGVEIVVAENASWVRLDGEDGVPVDHDQWEETADAAAAARAPLPGMAA